MRGADERSGKLFSYENIVYDDAEEFDARLGTPGLHRAARRV